MKKKIVIIFSLILIFLVSGIIFFKTYHMNNNDNEINNEITQQSLSISANEIFRMAAIAFILLTVLVWFAKAPFTAKGVG